MITGVVGHIKWHHYPAAAINNYAVARSKRGEWSLSAIVVLSNAYNMAQTPLVFIAKHKRGEWTWPILSLSRDSYQPHLLTATLGPPLKRPRTTPRSIPGPEGAERTRSTWGAAALLLRNPSDSR